MELKKPLGMFLANDKNGNIFVEELVPGGAAEQSGLISVGDRLIATSAIVFNSEMDYGGVSVKKGEEQIRFSTRGRVVRRRYGGYLYVARASKDEARVPALRRRRIVLRLFVDYFALAFARFVNVTITTNK